MTVSRLFPPIEPFQTGTLDVGDDHRVWFCVSGKADGRPVLIVHGGPGSGSSATARRFFDPDRSRIIQLDQRGCGRSTPHAGDSTDALQHNTTADLIDDMELLRKHLGIDRWSLFGGSWGSTLSLAYAQAHPNRVNAIVLHSVALTRRDDVDWITRGVGRFFPCEHAAFVAALPETDRAGDPAAAYARLLQDPNPETHRRAAQAWCTWEQAILDTGAGPVRDRRFEDDRFALGFARLVTHYWSHAAWLAPNALLDGVAALSHIPATLVHGRLDFGSPLSGPWALHEAWPGSRMVIVETAGHGHADASMTDAILDAAAGL